MTTNYIKRTPSKMKNRIIAIITVIMMVISIVSLTTLAAAEDAYYTAVMEAPNEYAQNEVPLNETESNAASESDNEQGSGDESNEPDSSASDESTDGDIGNNADIESPYDNSISQNDDSHYEYDAYESEDEYEYDDEDCNEEQCKCECEYYCDYDCKCECDYVEIEAYTDFIVTDWDGLYDVFTNSMITDGPYTVDIVGSITMEAQLNIPAGKIVSLTGGGALYQPTAYARHFTVDGTLNLNGITLRGVGLFGGPANFGGIVVNTNGELIVNAGSIIENNFALRGGGVNNNGRFTMNGGEIRRNFATGPWTTTTSGGGVYNSGIFIMNDGLINANSSQIDGGGVYNSSGEFIMNGGSISDNGAQDSGDGVFVRSGTFTMYDGEISRNTSRFSRGAGISVGSNGTFIMRSGEISRNTSVFGGGGVRNSGQFTMYGGSISENRSLNGNLWMAPGIGGGVENSGQFIMNGGIISGNTAHSNSPFVGIVAYGVGGGVYNHANGTFTMNNGTITGNNANIGGGVNNAGTFLMRGGTINDNIAREDAESVWWDGSVRIGVRFVDFGTPSMTGGYISNSTDVEVMVVYGTQVSIGAMPILERFGYNFAGWLLGDELLTSVEVAEIIMNESMTLVAQWVRSPEYWFTVTFAPGTQGAFTEQVFTDIFSGTATPAFVGTPTGNEGWLFTGWSPEVAATVTANVTYVAQWEEIVQPTPDPEYRTIRIYYYLEGYGRLVNDTANSAIGREYVREVGSTFSLMHVVDRNELGSDIDYVFEGWRVYLNDVYDNSYIDDINVNQLRGSFTVPESTGDGAALISLVAVWSIVDAQGGGNGDDNGDDNGSGSGDGNGDDDSDDNNETTTPPRDDNQKRTLPATGIEGDVFLWLALLALTIIVGLCVVAKVRSSKK